MNKRINIVLSDETIRVLDRAAPKGNRSRLISEAVLHYIANKSKNQMANLLREGALKNTQRDAEIAETWFSLDEQIWPHSKAKKTSKKPRV